MCQNSTCSFGLYIKRESRVFGVCADVCTPSGAVTHSLALCKVSMQGTCSLCGSVDEGQGQCVCTGVEMIGVFGLTNRHNLNDQLVDY